jgi:hypothetical protein
MEYQRLTRRLEPSNPKYALQKPKVVNESVGVQNQTDRCNYAGSIHSVCITRRPHSALGLERLVAFERKITFQDFIRHRKACDRRS